MPCGWRAGWILPGTGGRASADEAPPGGPCPPGTNRRAAEKPRLPSAGGGGAHHRRPARGLARHEGRDFGRRRVAERAPCRCSPSAPAPRARPSPSPCGRGCGPTISAEKPAGPASRNQLEATAPGKPPSTMVGTSGTEEMRVSLVTARPRMLPPRTPPVWAPTVFQQRGRAAAQHRLLGIGRAAEGRVQQFHPGLARPEDPGQMPDRPDAGRTRRRPRPARPAAAAL